MRSLYSCKMCGATLNIRHEKKVVECETCWSRQTLPTSKEPSILRMFDCANYYRRKCEFDKAKQLYDRIIELDNEPEAHWGRCLCRYGVDYPTTKNNRKPMAVCRRIQPVKMAEDEDFLAAVNGSEEDVAKVYRSEQKFIDSRLNEMVLTANEQNPYDIYICCKECDELGVHTPDGLLGKEIYDRLTKIGYRVFFSRTSLADKTDTEQEPYIYAALNSAKVMILIGTTPSNVGNSLVRNEWSRYLANMTDDKVIIPCCKEMSPYEMPEEFVLMDTLNAGHREFMDELVQQVESAVGTVQGEAAVEEMINNIGLMLAAGNWQRAVEYSDCALKLDNHCGEAYLGRALAQFKRKHIDELRNTEEFELGSSNDFVNAAQFADEPLRSDLRSILNENIELLSKQNVYRQCVADAEKINSSPQNSEELVASMNAAQSVAARLFEISDYRDSMALAEECNSFVEWCRQELENVQTAAQNGDWLEETLNIRQAYLAEINQNLQATRQKYKERRELIAKKEERELRQTNRQIADLKAEIKKHEDEIAGLGMFGFSKKQSLQQSLERLQSDLKMYEKEIDGIHLQCEEEIARVDNDEAFELRTGTKSVFDKANAAHILPIMPPHLHESTIDRVYDVLVAQYQPQTIAMLLQNPELEGKTDKRIYSILKIFISEGKAVEIDLNGEKYYGASDLAEIYRIEQ